MDPAPYKLPDSEQVFVKVGYKVSNHMEKRTKQRQAKTVKQSADRFSKLSGMDQTNPLGEETVPIVQDPAMGRETEV